MTVVVAAVITTYLSCDKGPSISAHSFKSDDLVIVSDTKALRSERLRQLASRQLLADQPRPPRRPFVRASTIRPPTIDAAAQSWLFTLILTAATEGNTGFAQGLVAPSIPLCSPHFLQMLPVGPALAHVRLPRLDPHFLYPAYGSSSNSTVIASITDFVR